MDEQGRLIIESIDVTNFKSYGGKRTIGPFHNSFSSIIGPNGSGKSNVIDALLFVFGFRAKKLRLKKLSELIHRSDTYPSCESAEVAVNFAKINESEGEHQPIPNSQLQISRRISKRDVSTYYINGSAVKQSDVVAALLERKIDLNHNRFLILQGEVEQISLMKPKGSNPNEIGFLEYLEDISGSSVYIKMIDEKNEELEKITDQRECEIRALRQSQNELDSAAKSSKVAVDFLSNNKKLYETQSKLFTIFYHDASALSEKAAERKIELEVSIEETKKNSEAIEEQEKDFSTKLQTIQKDHSDLQGKLDEANEKMSKFDNKDVRLQADRNFNTKQLGTLKKELKEYQKKKDNFIKHKTNLEKSYAGLEEELVEIEQSKEVVEEEVQTIMESLKGKVSGLQDDLNEKQKQLRPLREEYRIKKSSLDKVLAEVELLTQREQKHNESLETLKTEYDRTNTIKSNVDVSLSKTNTNIKEARSEIDTLKESLADLRPQETELKQKVEKLQAEFDNSNEASKSSSSNRVVTEMARFCKANGLGFLGRLGDLGTISGKFDVAVSTAASGSLNALVVKTEDDAQQCIAFLRKKQLGRITFFAVDKMSESFPQHKIAAGRTRTPSGCPRVVDQIKCEPQVLPVFYYALRDTIVAKDINEATKVAYGNKKGGGAMYNIVTLDGRQIKMAGTMSGGGNRQIKGLMKLSESGEAPTLNTNHRPEAEIERDLNDAQHSLDDVLAKIDKIVETLARDEPKIPQLSKQIELLEHDLANSSKRVCGLAEQIADLEKIEPLSAEEISSKSKLGTEIKKLQKELDDLHSSTIAPLETEASEIEERILNVGGKKLRKQKAKSQEIDSSLQKLRSSIAKNKASTKSTNKSIANAEKTIEKNVAKTKETQEILDLVEQELVDLESVAMEIMNEKDKLEEQLTVLHDTLKKQSRKLKNIRDKIKEIKEAGIDHASLIEDANKIIRENDKKAKYWDVQLKSIKEKYDTLLERYGDALGLKQHLSNSKPEEEQKEEKQDEEEKMDLDQPDDDDKKRHKSNRSDEFGMNEEELKEVTADTKDDLKYAITMLEQKRDEMQTKTNLAAIDEYLEKKSIYDTKREEVLATTELRNSMKLALETLRKDRLDVFMRAFMVITKELRKIYQMITLGGDAELELVDSLDPFSEGIAFSVRPPQKSWKNISNLSGGEKTLSSLALIFALHAFKPTPLYIMDEIDAALDFKNVSIIANYIKERTKNAQFVIISLRNNMFELADRLVGIYKTFDVTKTVTINPSQVVESTSNKQETN
eukprot:TRINITY_DN3122_c0_g1_i1.p1 TRINITY_DN3122_c0_g1~~TRINITY_DN3122_c0_g1_i1.p1  ORF type:complete len:1282 (+),score=389.04 TRINITY_DN3122_c0_g1_i1:68-3913(+)